MASAIDDVKVARCATYLEPELYFVVQAEASKCRMTVSKWLRTVALQRLMADGKISADLMMKLAGASRV